MKYVLLGTLNPEWAARQSERLSSAKSKLKELGIKLASVSYTQGQFDFVTTVDAPDPDAVLAFSIWYASQGYGRLQSLPAFDVATIEAAIERATKPARRKEKRKGTTGGVVKA